MSAFIRDYARGTGSDIYIPVVKAGSIDFAVTGDWTPDVADVQVSKDGGAAADIGTAPTFITDIGWKFVFTDAELTAKVISINIVDAATKAIEDQFIVIETRNHPAAQHNDGPIVLVNKLGTVTTQTSMILGAANAPPSVDADTYIGCECMFTDQTTGKQIAFGEILTYTVTTGAFTLKADPGIFTIVASDFITIYRKNFSLRPAVTDRNIDIDANDRVDVGSMLGTAVTISSTTAKPEVDAFSISNHAASADNLQLACTAYSTTRGLTGTALPAIAAASAGGLYIRGTGAGAINQAANGQIDTNPVAISGSATAANNLELDYIVTGYAKAASTIGTCTTNTDMVGTDSASTHSAADVWAVGTKELTGFTGQPRIDLFGDDEDIDASVSTRLTKLDSVALGFTKNAITNNIPFPMVLAADHVTPATGLTVAGERSIDGASFGAVTGSISETGDGMYQLDASAADMNGDIIVFKFDEATADDVKVTIKTS